jgi:hypothetical protein
MIYIIRPAAFLFRCFSEFRKKVHRPRKYLKNSYHFRPLVWGSPGAQQPQSEGERGRSQLRGVSSVFVGVQNRSENQRKMAGRYLWLFAEKMERLDEQHL